MNAPSKFLEIDSGLPFFVCHETKMAVRNRISDRVRFGNPSGKNGKEAKKLFSVPLLGILILDSRGQIIKSPDYPVLFSDPWWLRVSQILSINLILKPLK